MGFRSRHDPATMVMHVRVECNHCPPNARQFLEFSFGRGGWRGTSRLDYREMIQHSTTRSGWEWASAPINEQTPVVCPLCLGSRPLFSDSGFDDLHALALHQPHSAVRQLVVPLELAARAADAGRQVPSARRLVEILNAARRSLRSHEADIIDPMQEQLQVLRRYLGMGTTVPIRDLHIGPDPQIIVDETVAIATANLPGVQRLGVLTDDRPIPPPKPKPPPLPRTVWERLDDDDFEGV